MSPRPVVVLTHRVHEETLAMFGTSCDVLPNQSPDALPDAELRRRSAEADALMVFMPDRVDTDFLHASPRLRVVAGALKGYDNIDVGACTQRGVWVTRVEDLLTQPTAELALGLLIGLARNVAPGDRQVREGFAGWRPVLYGRTIIGSTIGIVGAGVLGQAVARLLSGFDARLLYYDPQPVAPATASTLRLERVSLDELLRSSDAIVSCAPLLPETTHLLNEETLSTVRHGTLLVNVGRGSVVSEDVVAGLLRTGHLGGYAADVFEFEDRARPDRPKGPHEDLIRFEGRTLFTPHLGSAVASARVAIERQAARSILQAIAGEVPEGAVNDPRRESGPVNVLSS